MRLTSVLFVLGSCILSTMARPPKLLKSEPADDFAIPPILHGGFFGPEYKENFICERIDINLRFLSLV